MLILLPVISTAALSGQIQERDIILSVSLSHLILASAIKT